MDATIGLQIGIPVAMLLSVFLLRFLDPGIAALFARVRSRLLLGLPVGTVLTVLLVTAVYLFVQGGFWNPYSPLTIPFTSWSYLYPLGLLTAPFAHQGIGHLLGNMIGFLAFGTVAEYAFGHFPTARGTSAFGSWRTNPYVRALVVFPAGAVLVGLMTSVFAWGPIIGFSGVVFAAAGFAVVRFPMVTVVTLVGREFIGLLYNALREPIAFGSAGPSFGPPWWAGIAIQGHLLGFLVGALLGTILLLQRGESERPSAFRLWVGTLLAGSSLTLWAVWWFQGTSSYVLYRGPGLLLILVLAGLIASAVRATDRPIVEGISRRQVAVALLAVPVLTMGFAAVPFNLTTIEDTDPLEGGLEVDGYTVAYAEEVRNRRIGAVNISFLEEVTAVNSSGVIVVDRNRQVWDEAVSRGRLANRGSASVAVGGLGWREVVDVRREGWRISGGGTGYLVFLRPPDGTYTSVFESEPVKGAPVIAGRNVTLVPKDGEFLLAVKQSNETVTKTDLPQTHAAIPEANESVEVGGLTFEREDSLVYASRNDTRVPLLQKETYQ